jgi:hypothetical protein
MPSQQRPSSPEFSALENALSERLAVIGDREWFLRDSAGHLEALKSVSTRIEQLAADLPSPVHPELRHFLERCSYDKALAFLRGV